MPKRLVLACLMLWSGCRPSAVGSSSTGALGEARDTRLSDARALKSEAPPVDVVVILDASYSMTRYQLEPACAFVGHLLDILGSSDRFALIVVAEDARAVVELEAATDDAKSNWMPRIDAIRAGGLTDLSAALALAHEIAPDGARRVLISDGSPTWGTVHTDELAANAERELITVGVGRNREDVLRTLGRYYFLTDPVELAYAITVEVLVPLE